MEQQIGVKAVEFDEDASGNKHPNRRDNRSARKVSEHEILLQKN